MSSRSACCGSCSMERRRRRSCASRTPRRRPPTWPTAFSPSSRSGRASTTAPSPKRSSTAARTRLTRRNSSSRGNCSRARSRTPGGLKIQTLHAFAERLLRLFPFEANVPAHFKVLDERESKLLLLEARDAALAELSASSESVGALDLVARESGAARFDELLKEALSRAETFGAHVDALAYVAALSAPLGLEPSATAAGVEAQMLGGEVERMRREAWAQALEIGKRHDRILAANLRAANQMAQARVRVQALLDAFFKDGGEGEPRGGENGRLTTNGLCERVSCARGRSASRAGPSHASCASVGARR